MAGARLRSLLKSATVYEAENRGRSLVASPPNTPLQMRCKSTGGCQWQMVLRDNACPSCLGITRSCTTGKAEAQIKRGADRCWGDAHVTIWNR